MDRPGDAVALSLAAITTASNRSTLDPARWFRSRAARLAVELDLGPSIE
jgi:hypothetical protein